MPQGGAEPEAVGGGHARAERGGKNQKWRHNPRRREPVNTAGRHLSAQQGDVGAPIGQEPKGDRQGEQNDVRRDPESIGDQQIAQPEPSDGRRYQEPGAHHRQKDLEPGEGWRPFPQPGNVEADEPTHLPWKGLLVQPRAIRKERRQS